MPVVHRLTGRCALVVTSMHVEVRKQSDQARGTPMLARRNRTIGAVALMCAAVTCVALTCAVTGQVMAADDTAATAAAPAPLPSLAPILKKITPAVVKIEIRGLVPAGGNQKRRDRREIHEVGSGVVFDAAQGLIITNHHVIANAGDITVAFTDGRVMRARKVGSDPDFDVALVRVTADQLPSIPFGDSSKVEVGDIVLAIGYPANMAQSVTSGIVGGLHRTNIGIEQHENFIQTDAAVYPGNSGGALVNVRGELVGINTAFIGSTSSNPGVGFAIPVNLSRTIAGQLLKYGDIRRGTLGVTIEDPTAAVLRDLKLAAPQPGAVVTNVTSGSAGERAGLKVGDVVVRVGGAEVRDAAFLRTRIALLRIGETAELDVLRAGKEIVIKAVIAERQPQAAAR
jgi:S1-C subfamily serine protease